MFFEKVGSFLVDTIHFFAAGKTGQSKENCLVPLFSLLACGTHTDDILTCVVMSVMTTNSQMTP